jgi:hypothetical protein
MMEWVSRNDARFLAVDLELDTTTPGAPRRRGQAGAP